MLAIRNQSNLDVVSSTDIYLYHASGEATEKLEYQDD